jgi:hypothetical protein
MPEQHNPELREAARDFPERARKLANLIAQEADAHSGSAIGPDSMQFYVNISPPPTWDELRGIARQLETVAAVIEHLRLAG